MTARTWLYAQLSTLQSHGVGTRVFAKKSMTSLYEDTPYIVYKMGNSTAEGLSEERDPDRQFVQIWVHDFHDGKNADYIRIDEVIKEIKEVLVNRQAGEENIWTVRYLETSQDLNDETLNTVMRYLRFQIIKEDTDG